MAETQPATSEETAFDERAEHRSLLWAGLLAGLIGCVVPLALGLAMSGTPMHGRVTSWTPVRALSYAALALIFMVLTQLPRLTLPGIQWLCQRTWAYLLLMGLICLLLQTLSGDPFIQPIIFTVSVVYAALEYPPLRTVGVCLLYLGLMILGLWLGGQRAPEALSLPLLGYGMSMVLIYAFTRLSLEQNLARRRTNALAAALAQERDYLARLVEVTATLTRDLELLAVLEQVAAAGRSLAHAGQARIWLREADGDDRSLRLAAAVPRVVSPALLAAERLDQNDLHSQTDDTTLALPLVYKGQPIGLLELSDRAGSRSESDAQRLQPFADAAAVAIENARLYEQSRLSATLAERNRLARELHDTIAQGLTAVTMQLEAAQRSFDRDQSRTRARLTRAYDLSRETLEDVRRSVWTLAEPLVDGATLDAALDDLARRFESRTGIAARYRHDGPPLKLDHAAATQILRIVQEALQNVEKHARASEVVIGVETDAEAQRIWVRDNGSGFALDAAPTNGVASNGFGLIGLRERARLLGGALTIESAPGAGTRIAVTLPAHDPALHDNRE
ncbi:MAG TPA: GAF domain-containing sensor histidine kinase [Herpetosiphonaceae bacterium]